MIAWILFFFCSPPDYVRISVVLLIFSPPCACIALYWALKAKQHMKRGENKQAWQLSNKVIFFKVTFVGKKVASELWLVVSYRCLWVFLMLEINLCITTCRRPVSLSVNNNGNCIYIVLGFLLPSNRPALFSGYHCLVECCLTCSTVPQS